MGYHNDLGRGRVAGIHKATGFPMTEHGHLLDPLSHEDGTPVKDWDKAGTELWNTTNPYGFLEYACGSGDDFYCFDFKVINAGPKGQFIILDSTLNSETGSFIEGGTYDVMPCNSRKEKVKAITTARRMVDSALEWCGFNNVPHDARGWNQEPYFVMRDIAHSLFEYKFTDKISERQIRMGGKRVSRLINKIILEDV